MTNLRRKVCGALLFVLFASTSASAQSAPNHLIIRFTPGALEPPPGGTAGPIEAFTFDTPGLRLSLVNEGAEHLARLFPTFRSEDRHSKNLIGEPVLLDDLSEFYIVTLRPGSAPDAEVRLRSVPGVGHVGRPQPRQLASIIPNDRLFPKQWGLDNTAQTLCSPYSAPPLVADADINAPEAWSITTGISSVRVGILDTGISATHWDFEGRVNLENGVRFAPVESIGSPCTGWQVGPDCTYGPYNLPRDDQRHGTAVAGIVAASGNNDSGVAGVAWGVTPIAIKLFDCNGWSSSCISARGIDWARTQAIPILSMSYGYKVSGLEERLAARNAFYSGQLLVAAMHNHNARLLIYPAAYRNTVCAVGAFFGNGRRWNNDTIFVDPPTAYGSNWGSWIDLAAPGGRLIATTLFINNNAYFDLDSCSNDFAGTSSATPVVAGVAALILSKYPGLLGEDLYQAMIRTARDVSPPGFDDSTGFGHVRADAALNFLGAPREIFHRLETGLSVASSQEIVRKFRNIPGLPDSVYSKRRYLMQKSVSFNPNFLSTPDAWVRSSGTLGARDTAIYDYDEEVYWGRIVPGSLTATGCTIETYVFELDVPAPNQWFPTTTGGATVALTTVGSIPPAAVTDFYADLVSETEAWLVWTAPGDDGNSGTAAEYDLRYATFPITEGTFANAIPATGVPSPAPAGTPQGHAILGLTPCTDYWFALKTRDEVGNWSALSNVAQASTVCGGGGGGFSAERAGAPVARQVGDLGEGAGGPRGEAQAEDPRIRAAGWGAGRELRPRPWVAGTAFTAGPTGVDPLGLVKPGGGMLAGEMRFEGDSPVWSVYFLGSDEAAELAGIDSAGVVYQVPGAEKGWLTRARLRPGAGSTRFGIRSASRPRRFVFLGQFGLEFAPRAVQADAAGAGQSLAVLAARHSTLGDMTGAVQAAGGYDLGLAPGDTLTLVYGPAEPGEGAQDWFLLVSQAGSVTGPAAGRRIGLGEKVELPTAFALRQNQPNPFSSTTTIRFELPVEAHVRLEVFDAQGRLVRTLADGEFPGGYHAVEWDERDATGRSVGSGVYLYRIQAGSFREQKKMVLLP